MSTSNLDTLLVPFDQIATLLTRSNANRLAPFIPGTIKQQLQQGAAKPSLNLAIGGLPSILNVIPGAGGVVSDTKDVFEKLLTLNLPGLTEDLIHLVPDVATPRFCFLVDENHPWPPSMIDEEPKRSSLKRFRELLKGKLVVDNFTTPQDLALKVATSLGRYTEEVSSASLYPAVHAVRDFAGEIAERQDVDRRAAVEALSVVVKIGRLCRA